MTARLARALCFQVPVFLVLLSVTFAAVSPQKRPSITILRSINGHALRFEQKGSRHQETIATSPKLPLQAFRTYASRHEFLRTTNRKKIDIKALITSSFMNAELSELHVSSRQLGLNGDGCTVSPDCVGTRECLPVSDQNLDVCAPGDQCVCVPTASADVVCSIDSDCEDGENCFDGPRTKFCLSNGATPANPTLAPTTSPPSTTSSSPGPSGLNGDPCTVNSNCKGTRTCTKPPVPCVPGRDCLCVPTASADAVCSIDSDCDDGENCVDRKGSLVCISSNARSRIPNSMPTTSLPTNTSSLASSGLNGDRCRESSDCKAPRECNTIDNECMPGDECYCIATKLSDSVCTTDSDCDDGESCVDTFTSNLCISDNADGKSDASCIGIESLTHFAGHELVFEQHALAHVLCDSNESCATPGHIVIYKDEAVMMRSYCKVVGCTQKVKRVNSPRYIQKLTVRSETEGLVFTVFAARFETYAEENMLSLAVRLGF